jgi:hypothetical protein
MEGRLRDFAAFLGEAAAVVNGRASLCAGNNALVAEERGE